MKVKYLNLRDQLSIVFFFLTYGFVNFTSDFVPRVSV
jgi:hypothetical protein